MHPAGPPPSQNRSCPSPSLAPCPSPSHSLIQQQRVIYCPITTLQPCTASLHPHCVYSGVQRNPALPGATPLTNQVPIRPTKGPKWQPKSKPLRGHQHHQLSHQPQYCQAIPQQHVQQPLSYMPKPLVLFDQCPANQSQPGTSFLVASSNFTNPSYGPGHPHSSASGLTLIPQPYFKAPDVPQAFCLLPERPQPSQHHRQSLPAQHQGSYYNVSAANNCSVQTINPKPGFRLNNSGNPYSNFTALAGGQINAGQVVPQAVSQMIQNPPLTLAFDVAPRDKLSVVSGVDGQAKTCPRYLSIPDGMKQQQLITPSQENIEWSVPTARESSINVFEVPTTGRTSRAPSSPIQENRQSSSTISKSQEERYSDESAASFDFTIEAEKMVSALCNTASSTDIGKDEYRGRNENLPTFSGAAGDNVTNKTNIWLADFCTEYGVSLGSNYRNTSTQTHANSEDTQQYPEAIRKTIYRGCSEAENILNSGNYRYSSRAGWLGNILCATKTAVTKSSTCFPIFSGNHTFVEDLINGLLRISNGWLVLDNYLNKQHYPSMGEKFERHLMDRFKSWEVITHDLLKELVKTFVKIEKNNVINSSVILEPVEHQGNHPNNSFPGDVSLYTNSDLFDTAQRCQENFLKSSNDGKSDRDSTYTLQYGIQSPNHLNFRSFEAQQQSQKETKLRSKWTITENLSSTIDSSKSVQEISSGHNDPGFLGSSRFRVKNSLNSSTKINSSTRHSLNAEFFHLRNKVMETMGNCSELDRQRWGLKEHQYDLVFGSSRSPSATANVAGLNEPVFKLRSDGTNYENSYTQRCVPKMDSMLAVNRSTTSQCTNVNGSMYLVSGAETALDSTYIAAGHQADRNKTYIEPDYTCTARITECAEHNCENGVTVSGTSLSGILPDPVYVGKSAANQRELAVVPRTRMTLLSQIEGTTSTANRDTKEMTANLSAWFASVRNSTGHRIITCPPEGKRTDNTLTTKSSNHPQENSRSAMDLNRQLHMDGNRQLQTLQNMQTIQSQPWNACNLLNNKRTTYKVQHLDEYDSSEDARVYMKPGSYNVPKKRHHRKNPRRADNSGSSRGNNQTPRPQTSRAGSGITYNTSAGKNHHISTSVSSLVISSSVKVSSTTTSTTTDIKVPFPASFIVPPTASLSQECSPRILRRVRSLSNQETRQDVAWKAACASAEILLEALNVKESSDAGDSASESHDFTDEAQESRDEYFEFVDRLSETKTIDKSLTDVNLSEASSYEASEDDSDSTCKFSPASELHRDIVQPKTNATMKTNVKTDSWLIRTLNNASIASKINTEESDAESTIGGSLNSSTHGDHREHQAVVTSTPEPIKNAVNDNFDSSTALLNNLEDSFQQNLNFESPRSSESRERSMSSTRQALAVSLVDTSVEFVGRATYSETVRRSAGKSCASGKKDFYRSKQTRSAGFSVPSIRNSVLPITGRKSQRKENDKTLPMLHKRTKMTGKRLSMDREEKDGDKGFSNKKMVEENSCSEDATKIGIVNTQTKKRDEASEGCVESKSRADRGWSVWYSSRRRQTLSPLALNKLATIHQTVWEMEGAQVLKYPSSSAVGTLPETIEDYCKIIKSPMFLETIEYKLKNRIYHKVDHVIRDFRRIINNSKLYHKNDGDRIAKVDLLSNKLEELFEEHFALWDFKNVLESPRDDNFCIEQASKYTSSQQQQKSAASRFATSAKKKSGCTFEE